jgi:hypothetical protein
MLTEKAKELFGDRLDDGEHLRLVEREDFSIIVRNNSGCIEAIQEPSISRVSENERKEAVTEFLEQKDNDESLDGIKLTDNVYYREGKFLVYD